MKPWRFTLNRLDPVSEACKRLNVTPSEENLYRLALTHVSVGSKNNERLEFLGDAVLQLVASEALYQAFPDASEGWLTRARSSLVRGKTLASLANALNLQELLLMGSAELKSGASYRESVLADTLEALFGAIWLDLGLESARGCILNLLEEPLSRLDSSILEKDPKSQLQELLQKKQISLPVYRLVNHEGQPPTERFTLECEVVDLSLKVSADAPSKRDASQAAAEQMLSLIQDRV